MFARWLSKQPDMLHHTTFDVTLSEIRLLDSGIVARACGLVASIARSGNPMVRLASGNGTIFAGFAGAGFAGAEGTLPHSNDVAPDYGKPHKHQSHFRERCLSQ
ncbi:MAG: hypothetical protein RLP44_21135 [Aggregatilineales bacterium]